MRSILIGLLLMPALWGQKTEWTVRYVAGPYRAGEGHKVPIEVLSDRVVLNGQNSIPVNSISEVAYQRVVFKRYEPMVSSENLANGAWGQAAIVGLALVTVAVVADSFLVLQPDGSRHIIHLIWLDSGRPNRLVLEASKGQYRALLAALLRVSGRPLKDFYDLPPAKYIRRDTPLDAAAQEAALRGVQASLGRRAPVPAHLAPEK